MFIVFIVIKFISLDHQRLSDMHTKKRRRSLGACRGNERSRNRGDHMSKAAAVAGVFSRMNSVSARYSVFYVATVLPASEQCFLQMNGVRAQ